MCLIDLTLLPMPSPRKSEVGLDNVKPASSVTFLFVGLSFTALAEGKRNSYFHYSREYYSIILIQRSSEN